MSDTAVLTAPSPEVVPRFRGRLHQIAFFVSIPAGVFIVAVAPSLATRLAAAVFALGFVGMFGASAGYHRIRWRPVNRLRMRRIDHSMIYVAIAGTYTPVVLVVLDGLWEVLALAAVWAFVAAGVFVKLFGIDRLRVLGSAMYIVLGWSAVVGVPQILRELGVPTIALMLAGGLLYTGGAIVLLRNRPNPNPLVFGYHEVWHAFVVAGWACHYAMVLLVLLSLY